MKSVKRNTIIRFFIYGFLIGLFFPVIAIVIVSRDQEALFSIDQVVFLHESSILFYIIDLAPFVIGILFTIIGKFYVTRRDYVIDVVRLERNISTNSEETGQKNLIKRIRKYYLFLLGGLSALLLTACFLLFIELNKQNTNYKAFQRYDEMRYSLYKEALLESGNSNIPNIRLGDLCKSIERNDLKLSFTLNDFLHYSQMSQKNKIKLMLEIELSRELLNIEIGRRNQIFFFIVATACILVLLAAIFFHLYVFFPSFIDLQKGVFELKLTKSLLENRSEALERAYEEKKILLAELNSNLENAEMLQKFSRKSLGILKKRFPDQWMINRPLQVLSGDFIWFTYLTDEITLIIFGDCVGHGVSASMLSNFYARLFEALEVSYSNPAKLISDVKLNMRNIFQEGNRNIDFDCELTVLEINNSIQSLSLASSQMEVFILGDDLRMLKSDVFAKRGNSSDSTRVVTYKKGEVVFIASDGLKNSLKEDRKRLGRQGIHNLLLNKKELWTDQTKLKGSIEQELPQLEFNDDVLIFSLRL